MRMQKDGRQASPSRACMLTTKSLCVSPGEQVPRTTFDPGSSLWLWGYSLELNVKGEAEAFSRLQMNQEGTNGNRAGREPKSKEKWTIFCLLLLSVTCNGSLCSERPKESGSWRGWLVVKSLNSGFRFQQKYRSGE